MRAISSRCPAGSTSPMVWWAAFRPAAEVVAQHQHAEVTGEQRGKEGKRRARAQQPFFHTVVEIG